MAEAAAHYFSALVSEAFIVLTTYRASGEAVPTTVWFAADGDTLYVTTGARSGKARRIAANSQVLVAASDQIGNVHGPASAASARFAAGNEAARADEVLAAKYGEPYMQIVKSTAVNPQAGERVFFVITPPSAA